MAGSGTSAFFRHFLTTPRTDFRDRRQRYKDSGNGDGAAAGNGVACGCKEGPMHTYEIHVITPDRKSVQVHSGSYVSDFAVIRRARALVGNGQHVEVRRGSDCIYASSRDSAPGRPAA
jgi:hypothetical protein